MEKLNCDLEVTTTQMKKELQPTAEISCISNIFWRDDNAEHDVAMFVCVILRPKAFYLLAGSKEWKRNIRLI